MLMKHTDFDNDVTKRYPDTFVRHECLCLTLSAVAELFGVTERTVRYWIVDNDDPLPAVRRDGGTPLFHAATVILWAARRRSQYEDFARWGGRR